MIGGSDIPLGASTSAAFANAALAAVNGAGSAMKPWLRQPGLER